MGSSDDGERCLTTSLVRLCGTLRVLEYMKPISSTEPSAKPSILWIHYESDAIVWKTSTIKGIDVDMSPQNAFYLSGKGMSSWSITKVAIPSTWLTDEVSRINACDLLYETFSFVNINCEDGSSIVRAWQVEMWRDEQVKVDQRFMIDHQRVYRTKMKFRQRRLSRTLPFRLPRTVAAGRSIISDSLLSIDW